MRTYFGSKAVEALRYKLVDPRQMQSDALKELSHLMFDSMWQDFSHAHSPTAVTKAVNDRLESLQHLDEIRPGGVPGTIQRYFQPATIVAYDAAGKLRLYMQTADNTSSSLRSRSNPISWLPAKLQLEAKYRMPERRHHAIGFVAVGSNLRRDVAGSLEAGYKGDEVSVVDAAMAVSMAGKSAVQSVRCYVWNGEGWLRSAYESDGLQLNLDDISDKDVFDDGSLLAQEPWKRDGELGAVREMILNKQGGERAVAYALQSAGLAA